MMVEKTNRPALKNIHLPNCTPQQEKELAQGMVRVNHLYRSALKIAVAQMEILDEEFATLNDRSPIHHIEYRIKTCLLYTSPSPRDYRTSRMPSSA